MKHLAITAASAAILALAGVETAGVVASGPAPQDTASGCDHWLGPGSLSVDGRPPNFQAATASGTYIWHDCDGWHLRALGTVAHGDNGAVGAMSIDGGKFRVVTGFQLTPHLDTFTYSGGTLKYHFRNDAGNDGLDFRISGEAITFHVMDSPGPAHMVFLGSSRQTPPSQTFTVYYMGIDGTGTPPSAWQSVSGGDGGVADRLPPPRAGVTNPGGHIVQFAEPPRGNGSVRRFDHVRLGR